MKKKSIFLYCFFLCIIVFFNLSAQQKTTGDPIPLYPQLSEFNDMELLQKGDEWEIQTKGQDPFLFVKSKKPIDSKTHYILSFESFNASETLPMVIFVGDVLDNLHYIDVYNLPRTEGWTTNAYDISITPAPPTEPLISFRIRFGSSSGKTLRIRNLFMREANEKEKQSADMREIHRKEDTRLSNRLVNYLEKKFDSGIQQIHASYHTGKIRILGRVNDENLSTIGLAEVPIWEDATSLKTIASYIPLKTRSFDVMIDRLSGEKEDRLLSAWAIVRRTLKGTAYEYELLSPVHYVDDIVPRANLSPANPRTLKGIGGCPMDHTDMKELQIASITFNVLLDQYIYTQKASGRIPYDYAGKTWYIDQEKITLLDREMLIAWRNNWMTSAIILIPVNKENQKKSWLSMASHPEAEYSAAFSMPNLTTQEGVIAYAAIMNFLAERYSRSDHKYGRIHYWIMHNEINNAFFWTSAGKKTIETYMNLYQKSMRMVQTIARQFDPNAKVFISLDHDWNRQGDPRSYQGKELLRLLLQFSRKEGDFEWGIAFHPYPQDINNPRTWEDDQATYSYNTPYLTYKNLEVLDAWVHREEVKYRGKAREIQFTEQGLNSPDYSEKSMEDQAAGLAYALSKIEKMRTVTAFQYHLWADAYEEGGLKLGLRKYFDVAGDPYGKKPIWFLYKAYQTPDWSKARDVYKTILNLENWENVYYHGEIK